MSLQMMTGRLLWLSIIVFGAGSLHGQQKLPVPAGNNKQLFYLQRTANTNTIVYELNYDKDVLNEDDPVHVFWIRYDEQGQKAELNFFQRKFAYGIKTEFISKDKYHLQLVSYKKFPMMLMKGTDNKYNVYATINQKQVILNCIFVNITGGSLWKPVVEYIEVKGTDPDTGKEVMERLKI